MKSKLVLYSLWCVLINTNSFGQLKVFSGGDVSLGYLNQNSDFRLSIVPNSEQTAFGTFVNHEIDWAYAQVSYVDNEKTKNWSVVFNNEERFFVLGAGEVWCTDLVTFSDSLMKENVVQLQNSSEKLLQLRGVKYNLKSNDSTSTRLTSPQPPEEHMGLIAQEVERIIPEIVETNNYGVKGVRYVNLIALLIEAFKEQNLIIDTLRRQITDCCNSGSASFRTSNKISMENPVFSENQAQLFQNAPNPFNTQTLIKFYLPENSSNSLILIFDMQGELIRQYDIYNNRESQISISGNEYKPGMYLYSLVVDGKEVDTKRMILTK